MKQKYFQLSCNFSKTVSFFELSPDAMTAYRESTANGAGQAQSCLSQSRGVVVRLVNRLHRAAIGDRDWTLAERLEGELQQMATSPEWSTAFHDAAMLTDEMITSRVYVRRYQQSLDADRDGVFSSALELNRALQEELSSGTEGSAFRMASISNRRLLEDEAYFKTRMDNAIGQAEEASMEE